MCRSSSRIMFTVDTLKFIATDNKSEKSISDEKKTSLSSRSLRDRFSGKSDKITGKIVYSHYYFIRVTLLSLLLRVITKSPTKLQQ